MEWSRGAASHSAALTVPARKNRLGSFGDFPQSWADLIVANISPAWISDLAPEWVRGLKPGGLAVLSGFEAGDIPRVSGAIEAAGARIAGEFGEREWRMLEVRHAVHKV